MHTLILAAYFFRCFFCVSAIAVFLTLVVVIVVAVGDVVVVAVVVVVVVAVVIIVVVHAAVFGWLHKFLNNQQTDTTYDGTWSAGKIGGK